jgi:signal transduction histidine kinase
MFSVFVHSYYHTTVRTGLESMASIATDFFGSYVGRSFDDYYDSALRYAENFRESGRIEMQFLNSDGSIMLSSSAITSGTSPGSPDIMNAINTGQISTWAGRVAGTNERIMATSAPMLVGDGEVIGIMRYVTSLRLVDRQVFLNILGVVGVGLVVLAMVLLLNMVFIRFVITPVSEITKMSKRIAEGSYGIQISNDYTDEIGDMVESINEMSFKIAQTEKIQTEFISSISHELRTPLTAITGWGETLIYNDELDDNSKRGISIILGEARRLTEMVEELLEFTKMEDGRFTLRIDSIDIAAELEETIFTFREILHRGELELDFNNDLENPQFIPGDPSRLRQVFLNIFDNALKHGRDGKRIEVYLGLFDEHVLISIRDFGPGVPSDEIENIKMKFYKGRNSKERGSGIGLAICEEIIKLHGGRFELSNAETGTGFVATISLPIAKDSSVVIE